MPTLSEIMLSAARSGAGCCGAFHTSHRRCSIKLIEVLVLKDHNVFNNTGVNNFNIFEMIQKMIVFVSCVFFFAQACQCIYFVLILEQVPNK